MNSAETYRGRTIWELTRQEEFKGLEQTNWWVVTGGPSTGKTTLLEYLTEIGYKTMPEAARVYIDKERSKGITTEQIRALESDFQEKVLEMKNRIEVETPSDELIFWDRGNMGDSIAYMTTTHVVSSGRVNDAGLYLYDYQSGDTIMIAHKKRYKGVFLLDRLPSYKIDYARVENEAKAEEIHARIDKKYRWLGYKPIKVPVFSSDRWVSIQRRAQFVIDHIRSIDSNLPLLTRE